MIWIYLCHIALRYFYSIYRIEPLNNICVLNESLENLSEENLLKILFYGAGDFTSQMNSEILKRTIKFIKKQIALVAVYFFSSLFSLTKYLVFIIFCMYCMLNLCTEFTVNGI